MQLRYFYRPPAGPGNVWRNQCPDSTSLGPVNRDPPNFQDTCLTIIRNAYHLYAFSNFLKKKMQPLDLWPLFLIKRDAEIIQAFNSTSRYLDDPLNIDNPYCEGMVGRTYPPELQLNKANASDTEALFLFAFIYFKRL